MWQVVWHRDEGVAVVGMMTAAIQRFGCHAVLVGSVGERGWSEKDLDVLVVVDDRPDVVGRLVRALDTIRRQGFALITHFHDQILLIDEAFRLVELWLQVPPVFGEHAERFTARVADLLARDKKRIEVSIERSRKSGRPPPGFEHVPVALVERKREQIAAYINGLPSGTAMDALPPPQMVAVNNVLAGGAHLASRGRASK